MLACSQFSVGLRLLDASKDFVLWRVTFEKMNCLNNYLLIFF